MARWSVVALALCCACWGSGTGAQVCPDASSGDVPARLAALRCLTALVHVEPARKAILERRIERGMRATFARLMEQPLLEEQLSQWKELYRLSAWHYPRREILAGSGGVPITFVNAHHFSLPFWIRRSVEVPLGTLVHFDTHSDMESIPRVDDVRRAVAWIRAGRRLRRAWHILAHAIHRNSMPVSGAVLTAGVDEILWVKPAWVEQPVDFLRRAFFFARPRGFADPRPLAELEREGPAAVVAAFQRQSSDYFQLFYDPEENGGRHLPRREPEMTSWDVVPPRGTAARRPFELRHRVRFSTLRASGDPADLARIVAAVPTAGFVLDVDLDYFVNIGTDAEASDDPPSFGETALKHPGAIGTVRANYRIKRLLAAGMAAERDLVEGRLRSFRRILLALRRAGKRPTIVSLADSSNLPFAFAREAREGRAYVPGHHAYWLRRRVVGVVREVFAGGPRSVRSPRAGGTPVASPPPEALLTAGSEADRARPLLRDALEAAVVWAGSALGDHGKATHLPAYLLLLHAVATHAPDAGLRAMAAAVARYHAVETLRPPLLGLLLEADRGRVEGVLRVLKLARLHGSREAGVALAGARWLRRSLGLATEPDVEAESRPLHPRRALALLGLERAFPGGSPAELADVLLGLQGRDGGFALPDAPAPLRAAFSLVAVRGLLGLLPVAPLRPEVITRGPGWRALRGRAAVAIRRAAAFAVSTLGEEPPLREALEAVVLLHALSSLRGHPGARRFADTAGRLLADRIVGQVTEVVPGAPLGELAGIAEAARAAEHFGLDIGELVRDVARARGLRPGAEDLPPGETGLAQEVAQAWSLAALGIAPESYAATLRRALARSGTALAERNPRTLVERFNLVANILYAASGGRRVVLDRSRYAPEAKFLASLFFDAMGSGQADLTSTYLESLRILGEDRRSQRFHDLYWQVLHAQQRDGGWGRGSVRERLRSTWSAVTALGDFEPGGPTPLTEIGAELARARAVPGEPR